MKKILFIILLYCGTVQAQDTITNVQAAGIKFKQSKLCEIAAIGFLSGGLYAIKQGNEIGTKFCFLAAGALQITAITLHFKAADLLIKPAGIVIRF